MCDCTPRHWFIEIVVTEQPGVLMDRYTCQHCGESELRPVELKTMRFGSPAKGREKIYQARKEKAGKSGG